MTESDPFAASSRRTGGLIRRTLARHGRATLAAALATVAVELAVLLAGGLAGSSERNTTLAVLAAGAVWIALAAPVLAAGADDGVGSLLTGGICADASAVALIVLWLATPYVTLAAAAEIYCSYAAMALLAVAAVRLAGSPAGRFAAAAATGLILLAVLATPFWIGGPMGLLGPSAGGLVAAAAVWANPFYSITSAVAEQTEFVWHSAPVMYGITPIGDSAAPPVAAWYAAPVIHGCLAGILGAVALLKSARR